MASSAALTMKERCTLGCQPSHNERRPEAWTIEAKASMTPSYATPDCMRTFTRSVGDVRYVPIAPAHTSTINAWSMCGQRTANARPAHGRTPTPVVTSFWIGHPHLPERPGSADALRPPPP